MVTVVTRAGKGSELTHSEVDANFNNLNDATTKIVTNSQTGTTYTFVAGDAGGIVDMSNASSNTVTIPPNSTVAFPNDTIVFVRRSGAGLTSVAAGSGVTLVYDGGLKISAQHKMLACLKKTTNTWQILGGSA